MDYSRRPGEPTPPLFEAKVQLLYHMIAGRSVPLTLIAGDHWLVYEGNAWTVDAAEPATDEMVAEILAKAGGVTEWWGL